MEDNRVTKVNYILCVFTEGNLIWSYLKEIRKGKQSCSIAKIIQLFLLHIESSVGL